MKTRTVTERIGEYLGPVDWGYDFFQHYGTHCTDEKTKREYCDRDIARLKTLSENKEKYMATTDGGWPRVGWGRVLEVGMYDGWPYWKPVPSVLIQSSMGSGWSSFHSLTDIEEIRTPSKA